MKIVRYNPGYKKYFERLNKAWLNKYFSVEPLDEKLLSQPEENILKTGGQILFAEHQGQIIGTVALLFVKEGVYELAKMTVDEAFRGIGAGKFLCASAVEEAKKLNAEKLILFTNSRLQTAVSIYRRLGFQCVSLNGQLFKRADTKMELLLSPVNWFDRKFDLSFGMELYGVLLERLQSAPKMFIQINETLPEEVGVFRYKNKWTIKENIGHLTLLEPLWQKRFEEIKKSIYEMSPADVSNRATDKMNFNTFSLRELLSAFTGQRAKTINLLNSLQESDLTKRSIHPRLQQPMRIVDLMYFVAEHDQHHLNAVLNIINKNS
ncbi:GNAT family N-acetyltransferase [Agriterribacter sp.]|uniref:GNAT family N-acetyltransferase n=1 Tax=Agriterribacter sp. TaxID=2821509 RepID=UPI002BE3C3E9|nr:GNAT family N-acetyltransferase [Agriterribacter sp.]HRP56993.1 GNAT family N-acetyltransferase [Agriterribacter sp.]